MQGEHGAAGVVWLGPQQAAAFCPPPVAARRRCAVLLRQPLKRPTLPPLLYTTSHALASGILEPPQAPAARCVLPQLTVLLLPPRFGVRHCPSPPLAR
jgi:hypothetical protein